MVTATISRQALWQRMEQGNAPVLIEVLPVPYFRKAHLPGAVNVPPDQIGARAPVLLPDKGAEIVLYCANRACANSTVAAARLGELGYANVWVYAEGKQEWIEAGLPVESSHAAGSRPHPGGISIAEAVPVACSLSPADLTERSETLRRDLFYAADEAVELPDGFAFRFPGEAVWKDRLFDFVTGERTCCSFFRIELVFEPAEGPIWLRLTGPEGVKDFVSTTFDARAIAGEDR